MNYAIAEKKGKTIDSNNIEAQLLDLSTIVQLIGLLQGNRDDISINLQPVHMECELNINIKLIKD
uniref:Uncharacterized protein n=1 Tax=Rhizophora mucronata TaxID=61149 RepID=A0A2P2PRS7_RHIMU